LMKRERAGNSDTLMHIRGADNPAANNPKNPDFREKKKRRRRRKRKVYSGSKKKEKRRRRRRKG
jgi:hypothetical protein